MYEIENKVKTMYFFTFLYLYFNPSLMHLYWLKYISFLADLRSNLVLQFDHGVNLHQTSDSKVETWIKIVTVRILNIKRSF